MPCPKLESAALTIAGSDSCGGAGIQADLKAFNRCGAYGASVLTAITAQNTVQVSAVEVLSAKLVEQQLCSVLEDLPVKAAKTGMLPDAACVKAVATGLKASQEDMPLIVDPVMVATSGAALAGNETLEALETWLMPLTTLITPNREEATAMTGIKIQSLDDLETTGKHLQEKGWRNVLMKGGHLDDEGVTDVLLTAEGAMHFKHPRQTGSFHGTGCTLSAAITAFLAQGQDLETSVEQGIAYVQAAMAKGRLPRKGSLVLLG